MYFVLEWLAIIVVIFLLASALFSTVCAALILHESARFIANAFRIALIRAATKSAKLPGQDAAWIVDAGVKDLSH